VGRQIEFSANHLNGHRGSPHRFDAGLKASSGTHIGGKYYRTRYYRGTGADGLDHRNHREDFGHRKQYGSSHGSGSCSTRPRKRACVDRQPGAGGMQHYFDIHVLERPWRQRARDYADHRVGFQIFASACCSGAQSDQLLNAGRTVWLHPDMFGGCFENGCQCMQISGFNGRIVREKKRKKADLIQLVDEFDPPLQIGQCDFTVSAILWINPTMSASMPARAME
jgi:hypothetical protein